VLDKTRKSRYQIPLKIKNYTVNAIVRAMI